MQIKKILLAVGVVAAFVIYSFAMRHQSSHAAIASSNSSGSTTSKSATTSGSGSSGDAGDSSSSSSNSTSSGYNDGSYTGSVADAFYGNVQVKATISGGKITDVEFLQAPNDSQNSQSINSQATPVLKQEAIQAQSAHVDTVTGATQTSQAFMQSLSAALKQAQA